MKELIEYNDRRIEITAYKVSKERDLLLISSSDTVDIDVYLRELEANIKSNILIYDLSPEEKLHILYKLRSISVGNILKLKNKCSCGVNFNSEFDLNMLITVGNIEHSDLKNTYSQNIEDYFKKDVNSYDLLDYEFLESYIQENQTTFNFKKSVKCPSCETDLSVDLSDSSIWTLCFSENDIMGLYQSLVRLSYSARLGLGVMDLYPFERGIFIDLVNQEIEDLNNSRQQRN